VAGVSFAVPLVSAATGKSLLEAEEICEGLARRERFIGRDGMEEWPDRTIATRYRFRHALHQDVAYRRIPPLRRSDWHHKIGERKESAYGERAGEIAAELAVHFEQGRNFQQAVHYFSQAGENAVRRSAYQEAVLQLSKGLDLLAVWADAPHRITQELRILTMLGPALMAIKGYAASEVENLYNRARGLCQQLGDTPQLLPVLGGLWVFYQVRAQLGVARELAEQILPLARRLERPAALVHPHMWLGQTLFCLGELRLSREHLEQSISLYDPQRDNPRVLISPQDPRETCLAYTSWALWLLGYPDQALEYSSRACTLSKELDHPLSLAHALNFSAWLYQARKEPQAVQHCIETVITLLGEDGSPYRLAQATILRGWAQVEQGQVTEGIVRIQQGLSTWRVTGAESLLPCYLALLAEAYHKAGNTVAGLDALTLAMEHVNKTNERWYEAELYRLKGELMLQQSKTSLGQVQDKSKTSQDKSGVSDPRPLAPDPQAAAEACFLKAIEIARRQQAKSLELRATVSLARLWQRQGKHHAARNTLSEIYRWFTEGFDTADLQEARKLLSELS
jgi:predicted ATPase